jgi:SpoVK/Ycf46/Vps4 family AAA+-type ATPase
VAGQSNWQASGLARDRRLIRVEFSLPSFTQRRALWHHFLGETKETLDLEAVAGQFLLTSGQIRDAVAAAHDLAAQAGRPLQNEDLFAAVRAHSNPRLAALARKLTLRYTWQDIVLPTDQIAILHEIVSTVRERTLVLETWGVGQKLAASKGVTILFAGPSGTGKTMAAEIIARELGLDLYKIDLSTVVSKYIGETEKNLERIFNEASSSNAILFFDEADAIFGKRSEVKDAHDRYANIETSYLLQRMEAYDGVTMLATNLRANLDEAFTRRLQFAVDFPFPEKVDRLRIWQTLFPVGVPVVPDIDFELLAGRFKLAGGNIRNIIVAAAYLAAADGKKVTMAHLLHGTRRELQKMGRLIGDETLRVE